MIYFLCYALSFNSSVTISSHLWFGCPIIQYNTSGWQVKPKETHAQCLRSHQICRQDRREFLQRKVCNSVPMLACYSLIIALFSSLLLSIVVEKIQAEKIPKVSGFAGQFCVWGLFPNFSCIHKWLSKWIRKCCHLAKSIQQQKQDFQNVPATSKLWPNCSLHLTLKILYIILKNEVETQAHKTK